MEYNEMLKNAVLQAKKGDVEGFETFYILTYQNVYQTILKMGHSDKQAEELMETLYVSAYGRIEQAPLDHLEEWLKELLYELGAEEPEGEGLGEDVLLSSLSEEKSATIFLKIEERLGILPNEEPEAADLWESGEQEGDRRSFFRIIISLVSAVCIVAVVCICLWKKEEDVFSSKAPQGKVNLEETQASEVESIEHTGLEETEEEKETVTVHLADQEFVLDMKGNLISSKREEEQYHLPVQSDGGYTYYLCDDPGLEGTLLRVYENDPERYELIDENVKDYVLMDNVIYYVKDGMIQHKDTEISYGKRDFTYHLEIKGDGFYMVNEIGQLSGSGTTSMEQDGLIYYLDNGYVQSVEESACWYNGIRYALEDRDQDGMDELCWYSQTDSGILVKEGYWIDSFCLVGDWIYYSAFEQRDPDNHYYSRVYRIRPDGSAQELVRDLFQGNITHMYYSQEKGKIYGEYMPDPYYRYYGNIVSLSLSGTLVILNDTQARSQYQTSGNDVLRFVGVSGSNIYCYWYDCQWTRGETARVMWIKPLILQD